jgi:NADH-quinone oxidoreductase subunit D
LSNNLALPRVEKLLGLEVPPRAQWMRVMLTELTRINSHLVWLGTHAMDIGAMSVFLYCFREREDILRIFEMFSGQRMMTSYFRIGGLALDAPRGWHEPVRSSWMRSPPDGQIRNVCDNPIWLQRTQEVGASWRHLEAGLRDEIRAPGGLDIARPNVLWHEKFDLQDPTRAAGDVMRATVRMRISRVGCSSGRRLEVCRGPWWLTLRKWCADARR